jgi:hypothetical protein
MSDALRGHLFITSVERAARLRFDGRFVVHSVHFVFPKTQLLTLVESFGTYMKDKEGA